MVMGPGEIVMWAAVLGLLIGIVWSLKYMVIIDRKIEAMDEKIERILNKVEREEERILKRKK